MKRLNDDRGVTLIALVVTIIIMMILTVTVTASLSTTMELKKYNAVKEDIIILNEEIQKYYSNNSETLPVIGQVTFNIDTLNPADKNPNDNNVYYKIDIAKLKTYVKQKYGYTISINNEDDDYLVNEQSLTIYYKNGIKLNGKTHYTIVDDNSNGSYASSYYSTTNLPIISVVTFESSGSNKYHAKAGDVLTLKIVKNYDFTTAPTATINGSAVTINWTDKIGTATYTIPVGTSLTDGSKIPFTISSCTADGRTQTSIIKPTYSEGIIYDSSAPSDVVIPAGLYYVGGTNDTGIVISDNSNDENKGDSYTVAQQLEGNQYVWVEVPKTTTVYPTAGLNIQTFTDAEYTKIENDLHTYASYYRTGSTYSDTYYTDATTSLTSTQYSVLKKKMLKSIYQNGGFWIGRYSAGIETCRTSHSTIDANLTPLSKPNKYPFANIYCSEAQSVADRLSTSNYSCSLPFGIQWDLLMKFIEVKEVKRGVAQATIQSTLMTDSVSIGNYNNKTYNITNTNAKYSTDAGITWVSAPYNKTATGNTVLTTGANVDFQKNNVYDFAGNVFTWSLETTKVASDPSAIRGGSYQYTGTSVPVAKRNSTGTTAYSVMHVGFRVVLY